MSCVAARWILLLYSHHHQPMHEGRFRIERDYRSRWFFQRPDGRAVPSCGYRAQDMIDDGIDNNSGQFSESLNNPSAEGLLSAVKTFPVTSPRS